jgi:hypothetical protein
MRATDRADELELALLKRGVNKRAATRIRCAHCQRTPLLGERIYVYEHGSMLCELCRAMTQDTPLRSQIVHGSEYGHTIRIADRRAA